MATNAILPSFYVQLKRSDLHTLELPQFPSQCLYDMAGGRFGKWKLLYIFDGEKFNQIMLSFREKNPGNKFEQLAFFWQTSWRPFAEQHGLQVDQILKFYQIHHSELPTHLPGRPHTVLLNDWIYGVDVFSKDMVPLPICQMLPELESPTRRIIVENLPVEVENTDIQTRFSEFGRILEIQIYRRALQSVATIEYSAFTEAGQACEGMNEVEFQGRVIRVVKKMGHKRFGSD